VESLETENAELKEENEELRLALERAGIDQLTSLFRLEKFKTEVDELIKRLNPISPEKGQSVLRAVVIFRIDVNKFKKFNEKPYNHAVGDKALRTVSFRLIRSTKQGDILGRVGGDEFSIAMPIYNDDVDFEDLARDFKDRINNDLLLEYGNNSLPITVSSGYSVVLKGQRKNAEQLLKEADLAERAEKAASEVQEDYSI